MSRLPPKPVRRLITLPVLTLVIIVTLILTPVVLPVLAVVDFAQGNRRFRLARFWLLLIATAFVEFGGAMFGVAALLRFGWRRDHPKWFSVNEQGQFWWVNHHLANLRRFADIKIEIENPGECSIGNAIVLSHHTSHVDALLPAYLFGPFGGLQLNYTLKYTLQWLPGIDLVASHLPNVWINRSPEPGSPMFNELENLGSLIDDHSVGVIFPEGTFRTPERLQRSADRVAVRRPDLEDKVRGLKYCLPARPAGVNALMRGAPDADLVIVGHVGLEKFIFLTDILANIPSLEPWNIRIWRFPRSEVPSDDDEFLTWITDRWVEMDNWIGEQVSR